MSYFNTFAANSPNYSGDYSHKMSSPDAQRVSPTNNRLSEQLATLQQQIKDGAQSKATPQQSTSRKLPTTNGNINQSPTTNLPHQNEKDYSLQISMMKSDVSLPTNIIRYTPAKLSILQNNVTQQILILREEKITLMEQLSARIDIRNEMEQMIQKILIRKAEDTNIEKSKALEKSSSMQKSRSSGKSIKSEKQYVPIAVSAQALRQNDLLKLKIKQLQIKAQIMKPSQPTYSTQQFTQLQQLIKQNSQLQRQLSQSIKMQQSNRFVTFQPGDKIKHHQLTELMKQYQILMQKHQQAQNMCQVVELFVEELKELENLKKENNQLLRQAEIIGIERGEINQTLLTLREKVQHNQQQKRIFLLELEKYKQKVRKIKQQNEIMRKQLKNVTNY